MAVSIKSNLSEKRVIFPRGDQTRFLISARKKLKLSWSEFGINIKVHNRTLYDWRREKYSMSLGILRKICHKVKSEVPYNIEIKDRFWYVNKGSKKGGVAMYKKYGRIGGDPGYRKKKWHEWWQKEGKYRKDLLTAITKPIEEPRLSSLLSEFIGIVLGDGGITARQVTITLNMYNDRAYSEYVKSLFRRLFGVNPSVYERRESSTLNIVVSRSGLVKFLIGNGLKKGGKVRQQVGIPCWIKESDSYSKACLRGLFDTDGCFYVDKHKYKDKIYLNAGMNFTNRSLPILYFFKSYLERLNFHPTQNTKYSISLRKEQEIIRYFHKIGSSNHKHLEKFKLYLNTTQGGVG